ncbi:hypothetical protein MHBO_000260 [Bonamia ostreae]|uniref:Uncharacterized protein n=1 Tax=Bonamia ostreae TaxID=126728 RepID=A0ABV2AEZ7_9EUKA
MSPRDFHKLVANPFDAELALSKFLLRICKLIRTKEWDGRYPMQTKNLLLDSENGVDELERATRSMVLQEKHRVEIIKNIEKSAFYGVSEEGSEEPAKIEKGLHGIARDYGKIK